MISLASGVGCSKSGAILRLLQTSGAPNTTDTLAIQVLASNGITIPNAVLGGGNIDTQSAGTIYYQIYDAMTSGANNDVKQAAIYLAVGGNNYDPCASGSTSLPCLQQAFRKAGCQPSGAAYPTQTGKYGSIQDATTAFQALYKGMASTDAATQDLSMKQCLGTSYYREPPKKCPEAPTYLGCFNDCRGGRAIPNPRAWNMQGGNNLKECEALAKQAGDNIFGLQYYRECWTGKNPAYDRMGAAQNCPPNGGGCTQQVYKINESSSTPGSVCGNYGRPGKDGGGNSIRLYSQAECSAMNGNWYGNGECTVKTGGSYSAQCAYLNPK